MQMKNIWFTSDTHFNHKNVIKYSNRPFDSIEDMDEILIQNWNKVVHKKDTIYHLGDFCFGNPQKYLDKLNGNIIRIKGSHDPDIKQPYMLVINPNNLLDEYGNKRNVVLCHYAMRSWPKSHYASYSLFGHSHGNLDPYGLSFDVGVDCWNYYPISLEQVEEKMKVLNPIVDFRK
jgi:calcineurin-like phosphoesterase family protein